MNSGARGAAPAWGAFAAMTLIWGSTFLAIRVSNLEGYEPLGAVAVRLVLAAALLAALARAARVRWPRGRELRATLLAGFLIYGFNFGLLYWGELTVPSATAAVLWGVFPTLVALGAPLVLGGAEPLTRRGLLGGLIAALGLLLVFRSHLALDAPLAGLAAILGGIAAAAMGSLLVKREAKAVHPVAFNALGSFAGAAALAPAALLAEGGLAPPPTPPAALALAYLVLAGSLGAFNLWAWLIQRWPATRLSFQTVLSPLVAVLLGALLLAEPLGPAFLAGTALVLAGTWLAVRAPARAVEPSPEAEGAAPQDS